MFLLDQIVIIQPPVFGYRGINDFQWRLLIEYPGIHPYCTGQRLLACLQSVLSTPILSFYLEISIYGTTIRILHTRIERSYTTNTKLNGFPYLASYRYMEWMGAPKRTKQRGRNIGM